MFLYNVFNKGYDENNIINDIIKLHIGSKIYIEKNLIIKQDNTTKNDDIKSKAKCIIIPLKFSA